MKRSDGMKVKNVFNSDVIPTDGSFAVILQAVHWRVFSPLGRHCSSLKFSVSETQNINYEADIIIFSNLNASDMLWVQLIGLHMTKHCQKCEQSFKKAAFQGF